MQIILSILSLELEGQTAQTAITEDAFIAMSAVIPVEGPPDFSFGRYAQSSAQFIEAALEKSSDAGLLLSAIGVVSDVCRTLSGRAAQYYDFEKIMNLLVGQLMNSEVHQRVKPVILSCFGDVAFALGQYFQPYLHTVMQVLLQAGQMRVHENQLDDDDAIEYVNSIHESNMEAYVDIVQSVQGTPMGMKANYWHMSLTEYAAEELFPYMETVVNVILAQVATNHRRSDSLTRAAIDLVGNLAKTFMQRIQHLLRAAWIDDLLKKKPSRAAHPRQKRQPSGVKL